MTQQAGSTIIIRQAQLLGHGSRDVKLVDGLIAEIAPNLAITDNDMPVQANGGLLLPGLIDHHCHLFATAAARGSVVCGPPEVTDEATLRALLQRCDERGKPVRGVGFHESVCERLDRHWLDKVCPHIPVRIQHRSGMLWVYNSMALDSLQIDIGDKLPSGVECDDKRQLTGRFFDLDEWLGAHAQRDWPDLSELSEDYARLGVTAVTDTGVNNGLQEWSALKAACDRGEWRQRLQVMGSEALQDVDDATEAMLSIGALKLYLREASLPDLDHFSERINRAHAAGRSVAIHCVTLVELHFALEAIAMAGPRNGDRIEHASVADNAALERMAAMDITAVSQPHFIAERGDQYLQSVAEDDQVLLYRAAGFLSHGVSLAAGSDAPYGSIDPWASMNAAIKRRSQSGVLMSAHESLAAEQALNLYGGTLATPGSGMRVLQTGDAADLCLLDIPVETLFTAMSAQHVVMTVCAGQVLYRNCEKTT